MAELTIQFVRPDRLMYEGAAAHIVLATPTGELGIWPGHAPLICALGDGIVRLTRTTEEGGATVRIIISGGYAEVENDTVIILADHARRTDDVEPEVVHTTLAEAQAMLEELDSQDNRRAYWENRVKWCNLLLRHAE